MLTPVLLVMTGTATAYEESDAGGMPPIDVGALLQAIQGHISVLPAASDGGYRFRRDRLVLEIDFENSDPLSLVFGIGTEEIPIMIPAGQGRRLVVLLEADLACNLPLGDWAGRLTVNAIGGCRLTSPLPFGPTLEIVGDDSPHNRRRILERWRGDGELSLRHLRDSTRFAGRYRRRDGSYRPEAVAELRNLLRCRDSADEPAHYMPPKLFELLDAIEDRFGGRTVYIVSAYRDPAYNGRKGFAEHSYHMKGLAIDLRVRGVSVDALADFVEGLKVGGVGRYPHWVHVDLGSHRRRWDRR